VIQAGPTDSSLIPKEITLGFTDITNKLNVLLESDPAVLAKYPPDDPRRKTIATVVAGAHDTLSGARQTVDGLNAVVTDKEFQANVRVIAKNLAEETTRLREILETIQKTVDGVGGQVSKVGTSADAALTKVGSAADDIGKAARTAAGVLDTAQVRIVQSTDKLAGTLKELDKTLAAIVAGDGTTGKLVKDSKLYDGLVDLTRSLHATTEELNKLVHQWKEDGVPLKVGLK
jgi:ABC-type transporter Mla subunit MlaD